MVSVWVTRLPEAALETAHARERALWARRKARQRANRRRRLLLRLLRWTRARRGLAGRFWAVRERRWRSGTT